MADTTLSPEQLSRQAASKALRASDLIKMLQAQIDEHGDGYAQLDAHGSWIPVTEVVSWHGRTIIKHEKVDLFPFHRKGA